MTITDTKGPSTIAMSASTKTGGSGPGVYLAIGTKKGYWVVSLPSRALSSQSSSHRTTGRASILSEMRWEKYSDSAGCHCWLVVHGHFAPE